jgi:Tfp pilus assembly protein PilF
MAPNIDAMIQQGVKAYRAGNKQEAKAFLIKAVELDQYNEQAWLWLKNRSPV